ncbi:MAG TPA: hypothetical protein VMM36_00620 [Opitutaceae bacterium]|nr:hypothetical protein [Opitutaceae bacterium]
MKTRTIPAIALLLVFFAGAARADSILGKWTSEFDSQIGVQKYVLEFKESGDRIVGSATFERSMGNGSVELKEIKLDGDKVSFVEPMSFDGNEIAIRYSGTLTANEMKLRRDVGEFATEHIVAKRVAPTAE